MKKCSYIQVNFKKDKKQEIQFHMQQWWFWAALGMMIVSFMS